LGITVNRFSKKRNISPDGLRDVVMMILGDEAWLK